MSENVFLLDEARTKVKKQIAESFLKFGDVNSRLFSRASIMAAVALFEVLELASVRDGPEGQVLSLNEDLLLLDEYEVADAAVNKILTVFRQSLDILAIGLNDKRAVPVPQKQTVRGAPKKYPFDTMAVHGTFRVECGAKQPKWESFRIYCIKRSKELDKQFRCHRYPDGTFEVWRER